MYMLNLIGKRENLERIEKAEKGDMVLAFNDDPETWYGNIIGVYEGTKGRIYEVSGVSYHRSLMISSAVNFFNPILEKNQVFYNMKNIGNSKEIENFFRNNLKSMGVKGKTRIT